MLTRKGILVAGGLGTRMSPITCAVHKHLLPVYDKPMVYYPLAVLMWAGVREILVVSTPQYWTDYQRLLDDGRHLGLQLSYAVQPHPGGIAQVYEIAADFLNGHPVLTVLGDNLFCGERFQHRLRSAAQRPAGSTIFACSVPSPSRFGVVRLSADGKPVALEEKPRQPQSHLAVTGLYFHDPQVVAMARSLRPSPRGELEITAVNQLYLEQNALRVELLEAGDVWLDAGTPDSLLEASLWVRSWQTSQGRKLACLEEIALQQGWLEPGQLLSRAERLGPSDYARYLRQVARSDRAGSG